VDSLLVRKAAAYLLGRSQFGNSESGFEMPQGPLTQDGLQS